MALQKAQFQRLKSDLGTFDKGIDVQFNPAELTFTKTAQFSEVAIPGLDMPIIQFVRGETETLNLDLFFDSTENGTLDDATPVTEMTDRFYELIKIDRKTHAPPVCRFVWGDQGFAGSKMKAPFDSQNRQNGFQCVVQSVTQTFTMFSANGRPLRAKLTVALKEYKTLKEQIDQIRFESADHTHSHVVQRGDTLARVAAACYGDPRQWRAIAEHNGLDDPLDLRPGTILEVPPLR